MGAFLFLEWGGGGILVVAFKCNAVCSLMSQVNRIGSDRLRLKNTKDSDPDS